MDIDAFKKDLQVLDDSQIVNKYYHSEAAFALSEDDHFKLRHEISSFFKIEELRRGKSSHSSIGAAMLECED